MQYYMHAPAAWHVHVGVEDALEPRAVCSGVSVRRSDLQLPAEGQCIMQSVRVRPASRAGQHALGWYMHGWYSQILHDESTTGTRFEPAGDDGARARGSVEP